MDRFEADYRALKKPLWILAFLVFAGTVMAGVSHYYREQSRLQLQNARSALDTQRSDFRFAVEAGDIIKSSRRRFSELQGRHFIGNENRLLWIESLRNSGRKHRLYDLRYSLKQQQDLYPADTSGEFYEVKASSMSLHMELRHEGHLVGFFDELRRDRAAVYQLSSCSLTSKFGDDGVRFETANVAAECDLVWYTLRPLTQNSEADHENI